MGEVAAKMSRKPTYKGVRISCECGGGAEFKEYRERWIKTLHGEVEVERAYYRCRECRRTYIPWDQEQGLDKRVWTPRVKELVATTCAALPYKAALGLVERTTGLVIEESSGEEIVRDVGNRLRVEEEEAIVAAVDIGEDVSSEASRDRLYISIDAAKAHTDGEWHDIKTCAIYEGERWAREHCEKLKDKGPGSLLRAMRRRRARSEQEREALRLERGYFRKYRKYMDYPAYRAKGMMIGSGPVESACKVVVGQRLKQSGMRWTRDGADVVLAVRTTLLSNQLGRIERAARAA